MTFNITPNVEVRRDADGIVRQIRHLQQPYATEEAGLTGPSARMLSGAYLRDVAEIYGFDESVLAELEKQIGEEITDQGSSLQIREQKTIMESTVVAYQQTYFGLPIWEAGFKVQLHDSPLRVTSSQSTFHYDVKIDKPADDVEFAAAAITRAPLRRTLAVAAKKKYPIINSTRTLIYRYDPDQRFHPEVGQQGGPMHASPPTLELPPVPDEIEAGRHYIVTEVLFTYPVAGRGDLNWRAFIEQESGAVLYLRAFVSGAFGNVFPTDPLSMTGNVAIGPGSPGTDLDPLTSVVTLQGLTPPDPGDPQELSGEYIYLTDISPKNVDPPTAPLPPGNFSETAVSDDFAAVNAYHHCDDLFRIVQGLGFNVLDYFDGTSFPVRVDHRATIGFPCPDGECVNAEAPGNAAGNGSDGFRFALAQVGQPVGIAASKRVVLHEFGHTLLWDHVNSPNFGFAHSAGDSLAAILSDPGSNAPDRYMTFPWITTANPGIDRRHDRGVAAGWAWGGINDVGGYNSEQILSTTHFRIYRSTGGDDGNIDVKSFAARYLTYLIIRAIGTLTPVTNPGDPDDWATALMDADLGTASFEGHPGGAFHKVIRWGFEKQGLYQPAGAPTPVISEGDPPDVDVYIDDGRNGEYQYQWNFWNTQDMWVRNSADGGLTHQTPIVGATNYMYVRVKNRGTQTANNVVVKAYNCVPAAGLVWPDDWQVMTTSELPAGSIPSGGDTIVGPFAWTPQVVGHECVLASVSADGDQSNADTVSGPIPHWRLVPFDNNIAQRNLAPVPGGGGLRNLALALANRRFLVRNPYERAVRVNIEAALPDFLNEKGWAVRFSSGGGDSFTLGPRDSKEVEFSLVAGQDFSADEVKQAGDKAVLDLVTMVDGLPVGGMSYQIDPEMKIPARELPEKADGVECSESARGLLECLDLPTDEVKCVKVRRITVDIVLGKDCC